MLTTPFLYDVQTFDAYTGYTFTFNVIGGNQVIGNNLVIERISDNAIIYNETQETFNFRHILPSGVLSNGVNYRAKIRTKDINNNWSAFSETKIFWCYSKPNIFITNIDYDNQNRVYNQTVLFEASYSQAENEQMQSYRYLLYNSNKDLLQSFPEKYSSGELPLTQEIAGLENGTLYYLEVKTLSPNGNQGSSGLIHFRPFYVAPKLVVAITPENLPDQGAIKISANVIQIIMKLYDNNNVQINPLDVEYLDSEYLDMTRADYGRLIADEGFNILQENFTMQLWCRDLPDNKVFLKLFSPQGYIEFFKLNNRIRAYKAVNNVDFKAYYVSNEFNAPQGTNIMLWVRQQDGLLDLSVEPY